MLRGLLTKVVGDPNKREIERLQPLVDEINSLEPEMQALSEPDTIDDWRTRTVVAGCRVTAAGATRGTPTEVARGFFDVLAASGWSRTPDPFDAPDEASLRYRRSGADCLFSYYDQTSSLGTEAEFAVSDAVELRPGERLFHFLIRCTPAAPAAPRGEGSEGPPSRGGASP